MQVRRAFATSAKPLDKRFKVLFCGHEFSNGFLFSKQAMMRFPNVHTVQCSRENLHNELTDADVVLPLMCRMGPKELEIGKNIKMIMQFGVGLEGVDVPSATEKGVWVCKIPSEGTGNAQSCAEHAIFLSLSLLRNVYQMKQSLLSGGLGNPMGRTLYRSTAIIYGYGGIGKQLLNRLKAFEMDVIVVARRAPTDPTSKLSQTVDTSGSGYTGSVTHITPAQMATTAAVRESSVLFLCCSQNAENMGFVDREFLQLLRPGVMIVNVARVSLKCSKAALLSV
jgi:lactate dehydrogenase-like 2-hydroxyacid dehydrogenase